MVVTPPPGRSRRLSSSVLPPFTRDIWLVDNVLPFNKPALISEILFIIGNCFRLFQVVFKITIYIFVLNRRWSPAWALAALIIFAATTFHEGHLAR